jgi:site-specific DNA recombinase
MTPNRFAIGYVRVSTSSQALDGVSLDAQREAITKQAHAAGLVLLGICSDEGISGKRADTRPGLQEAVKRVCERDGTSASLVAYQAGVPAVGPVVGPGVLIVYSLSRLARSTRDTLGIAERLERAGADLVSVSERIDTTGACGRMVFRMLAVLAEFERDVVSERTCAALAWKRERGEKLGGAVPYGYVADRSGDRVMLVEDAGEQAVIGLMVEMRERGMSLRKIGERLAVDGLFTRAGKRWNSKVLKSVLDRHARNTTPVA